MRELYEHEKSRVRRLVGTYFQVSRAYRRVTRLPPGMTGKAALRESGQQRCDDEAWIQLLRGGRRGSHYLSSTDDKTLTLTLTPAEFAFYLSVGGGTYLNTGPTSTATSPTWELYLSGDGGLCSVEGQLVCVKADNPDAAVASVFSNHWQPVLSSKLEYRKFLYRHPGVTALLIVVELEQKGSS